jgi:hypothetical protein
MAQTSTTPAEGFAIVIGQACERGHASSGGLFRHDRRRAVMANGHSTTPC